MNAFRLTAVGVILLLMIYVVVFPTTAYAPVPRLMLFTLASCAVAILLGAEASTRLNLQLPGFALTTAGTAALAFALLYFLTNAMKPDLQVAIYQVQDENGKDLRIDLQGAVQLHEIPSGRPGFFVAQGNYLVVLFPDLVPEQSIRIRKTTDSDYYAGKVTYGGTRQMSLKLGRDLIK